MNLALLGLTIFAVVLVFGTVFWLLATLGPLHRKQMMRKAEREKERDLGAEHSGDAGKKAPIGEQEKNSDTT